MSPGQAVIAIAITLVAAAFTLVGILLKVLINRVTPVSNGFAEDTTVRLDKLYEKLGKIRKTQGITLRRLDTIDETCDDLREADDTLLEMISELREPK